ncbi:MAG: energy-coupling factor ABC transporter permease [Chromatiaceae bacterium]|nr:energy-coupling factor ABC transporter permease [Chromatiaceae bacterium]
MRRLQGPGDRPDPCSEERCTSRKACSIPVIGLAGLVSIPTVAYAVAWVRRRLDDRKVVLMAVLGALIFALQMLNFPIQAGTSGHFARGALAGLVGLTIVGALLVAVVIRRRRQAGPQPGLTTTE